MPAPSPPEHLSVTPVPPKVNGYPIAILIPITLGLIMTFGLWWLQNLTSDFRDQKNVTMTQMHELENDLKELSAHDARLEALQERVLRRLDVIEQLQRAGTGNWLDE